MSRLKWLGHPLGKLRISRYGRIALIFPDKALPFKKCIQLMKEGLFNPIHNKNEEQLCHQSLFLVFIFIPFKLCYQNGLSLISFWFWKDLIQHNSRIVEVATPPVIGDRGQSIKPPIPDTKILAIQEILLLSNQSYVQLKFSNHGSNNPKGQWQTSQYRSWNRVQSADSFPIKTHDNRNHCCAWNNVS